MWNIVLGYAQVISGIFLNILVAGAATVYIKDKLKK